MATRGTEGRHGQETEGDFTSKKGHCQKLKDVRVVLNGRTTLAAKSLIISS